MSSTYSPDLRLELIGTGDQAGVWGATTNNNLGTFIENAVAGYTSVSIVSSTQALTANDGAADQARFAAIALTTTTGANFTVCIPPNSKLYTFYNASSYTATISNSTTNNGTTLSGGTTIAIPAGKTMSVWSDGTNVSQQNTAFIAPALGTPASGVMTNVTGLPLTSGVTGTLPVANGGTGVTTSTGTGNVVLSASPTLTGTPLAPTASYGTNTTQLATTAFVQAALQLLYPIGSIYSSTVSTNPGTLFGFGTWVAYAAGRVLLGDGGGYTAGSTGGSADAIVVSHTHTASSSSSFSGSSTSTGSTSVDHTHNFSATSGTQSADHTHAISISDPGHSHGQTIYNGEAMVNFSGTAGSVVGYYPDANYKTNANTQLSTSSVTTGITASSGGVSANHTHSVSGTTGATNSSTSHSHTFTPSGTVSTSTTVNSTGSSGTGANLQPYVVVYMWNRTA